MTTYEQMSDKIMIGSNGPLTGTVPVATRISNLGLVVQYGLIVCQNE